MSARRVGPRDDGAPLTRAEMAKARGISKTTLRRWEAAGKVKPIVDERGVHLYRQEDARSANGGKPIERLPKALALVPTAATAGGELAAEIFDKLDRKIEPADIVKELRVHPDVVEGFVARWRAMRGTVSLTADARHALDRLLRRYGVVRGTDLVADVKKALAKARSVCKACEECAPTRCDDCFDEELARFKRRLLREDPRRATRSSRTTSAAPLI